MAIPREPRRALAELRDHRKAGDALAQEAARLDREIPECRARLQEELSRPLDGSREDPELLRGEIARLKKSEEAASEQLLRTLQQREQLADRLEALSSAEQELEFWKEKLARDRKQAELLDETMACLDSAREELRNNYVGPLRRAFAGYMEKLMDEPGEKILMTADFHVRLERSGYMGLLRRSSHARHRSRGLPRNEMRTAQKGRGLCRKTWRQRRYHPPRLYS
jgi:hypothetical protein